MGRQTEGKQAIRQLDKWAIGQVGNWASRHLGMDAFEVLEPGLLTTVQDRGRYGYQK